METISPQDVRTALLSFLFISHPLSLTSSLLCCFLQYDHFIQLMERLLSLPYCAMEEEFVLRHRRQLEAQSTKQMVPTLERDDRGVAFSTSEGKYGVVQCLNHDAKIKHILP